MVATGVPARTDARRRSVPRILASLVAGVVVGLLAYYLIVVAVTAPIPGDFVIHPLALLLTAVVGALAVVVGWRWPVVGLTAGIVMLVLVAFALRLGWSSADWLNPFNALAYGGWSGYPTLLGAVMITLSALTLRGRQNR